MGITLAKGMRRTVQSIGGVFVVVAFSLLLVAVLTSKWVYITVARDIDPALSGGSLATYTRHRGLYMECWKDDSLMKSIAANANYRQYLCLHMDMRVLDIKPDAPYNADYKSRTGLLVGMWAVLGLSALFMFIAFVLYLYTLCQHVNNYQWKYGCKASAGLMVGAVLLNALGMALYHGAEYLELNTVTDATGDQAPYSMFFRQNMSQDLINRTTRMYGWSYALCWCAVACEILAAVLFMAVSCCYVKSAKSKSIYIKPKSSRVIVEQRSPSYEMVHEKVIVTPPKVYVVENDYYQNQRGTYDPYSSGQPQNGYSPSYNYDKGWVIQ